MENDLGVSSAVGVTMNRCWCFVGVLVLAWMVSKSAFAADRPHIVMAFADDWGQYASAYGKLEPGGVNDHLSTPNFDSISTVISANSNESNSISRCR